MALNEKERRHLAELVNKIRTQLGLNQTEFASLVGVKQSVISTWEQGTASPSGQNYFKLGSIAQLEADREWLWQRAGIDLNALDNFIDARIAAKKADAPDLIDVLPLDLRLRERIQFPRRFLQPKPLSVRYIRVQEPEESEALRIGWQVIQKGSFGYPFEAGDILLIEPTQNDLRKLKSGSFMAVSIKGIDVIGSLEINPAGVREHHVYVSAPGKPRIYLGSTAGSIHLSKCAPVKLIDGCSISGRVIAWVRDDKPEGR